MIRDFQFCGSGSLIGFKGVGGITAIKYFNKSYLGKHMVNGAADPF
jgi:hypothetical protein